LFCHRYAYYLSFIVEHTYYTLGICYSESICDMCVMWPYSRVVWQSVNMSC